MELTLVNHYKLNHRMSEGAVHFDLRQGWGSSLVVMRTKSLLVVLLWDIREVLIFNKNFINLPHHVTTLLVFGRPAIIAESWQSFLHLLTIDQVPSSSSSHLYFQEVMLWKCVTETSVLAVTSILWWCNCVQKANARDRNLYYGAWLAYGKGLCSGDPMV